MSVAVARHAPRRQLGTYVPRIVLGVLGLAVVVWLVIKASQGGQTFLQVTLNGITEAALYFVVAAGFTLIFGLMRVVNMAHGSLYLFGGYVAYTAQTHWFAGAGSAVPARRLDAPRAWPAGSCRSPSRRW